MADDVVRARRFELVDSNDRVRAILDIGEEVKEDEQPVGLTLYDPEGKHRGSFGLAKDGTALVQLKDGEDRNRAVLAVGASPGQQPRLMLLDSVERTRIEVEVKEAGEAVLSMSDEYGNLRATLATARDRVGLVFFGGGGKVTGGVTEDPSRTG